MPSEIKHVTMSWAGGLRFRGGEPGGPASVLDPDNVEGPSPMIALLEACVGCSGADVVSILEKMQVTLQACDIEVAGTRREDQPRRYTALHLRYRIAGDGVTEAKARRAIDLSLEKYCSVMLSLNPDVRITYDLELG